MQRTGWLWIVFEVSACVEALAYHSASPWSCPSAFLGLRAGTVWGGTAGGGAEGSGASCSLASLGACGLGVVRLLSGALSTTHHLLLRCLGRFYWGKVCLLLLFLSLKTVAEDSQSHLYPMLPETTWVREGSGAIAEGSLCTRTELHSPGPGASPG